jgi:hypothetical protein
MLATVCAYLFALPIMLLVYVPALLCGAAISILFVLVKTPRLPRALVLVKRFVVDALLVGLSAATFLACCDVAGVRANLLMFLIPTAFFAHLGWRRLKRSRSGTSTAGRILEMSGARNARRYDAQMQAATLAGNLAGMVAVVLIFRVPLFR